MLIFNWKQYFNVTWIDKELNMYNFFFSKTTFILYDWLLVVVPNVWRRIVPYMSLELQTVNALWLWLRSILVMTSQVCFSVSTKWLRNVRSLLMPQILPWFVYISLSFDFRYCFNNVLTLLFPKFITVTYTFYLYSLVTITSHI